MKGVHFICAFCQLPVKHRKRDTHHCPGLDSLRQFMSLSSSTPCKQREPAPTPPTQLSFPVEVFNTL